MLVVYIGGLFVFAMTLAHLYYFSKRERELGELRETINSKSEKVLTDAHQQSKSVILQATEKANKILLDANYSHEQIMQEFDKTLKEIVSRTTKEFETTGYDFVKLYQNSLEEIKKSHIEEIKSTIESVKKTTETELEDFSTIMKKETIEAQDYIGKNITEQFEKTNKEIRDYKTEQLQKVDASIGSLIQKIAQSVLGRLISPSEHQHLVLEALEEAKKEGVFNA